MTYKFKGAKGFGRVYERLFYEVIADTDRELTLYDDDVHMQTQMRGIDLEIDDVAIDIKTQKQRHILSGNLPIETISVMHKQIPGWFVETDADAAIFLYERRGALPESPALHDTGYILIIDEECRDAVEELAESGAVDGYTIHNSSFGGYEAWNWMIPLPAFPARKVKQINVAEVSADGIYQYIKSNKGGD